MEKNASYRSYAQDTLNNLHCFNFGVILKFQCGGGRQRLGDPLKKCQDFTASSSSVAKVALDMRTCKTRVKRSPTLWNAPRNVVGWVP